MIGIVVVMHKSHLRPNGFELINRFIESLYEFLKERFYLYLFDNASSEKYTIPNYDNIKYTYIENQYIRGLQPINDGINQAIKDNCDIVIITHDDVIINNTINNFIDVIKRHKLRDISLYGSLSNGVLPRNIYQLADKSSFGMKEITGEPNGSGWLSGFFIAFTKEFYHKFKLRNGNLCNVNIKWEGGEINLHNRIKRQGGRIFVIKNCWIYHEQIRGWKEIRDR